MKPFISTLDINQNTPAQSLPPGGQRASCPEVSNDGDALDGPPPGRELPPAVTGAKKYECDACKVRFTVHWGKHTEECPCCDMMCDEVKT